MTIHPLAERFYRAENEARRMRNNKHRDILRDYLTIREFCNSLKLGFIEKKGDSRFPAVYRFYSTFFTLPNETESFEGFEATLGLNNNSELSYKYGRFREAWLYFSLPDTHEIIAGINFSVYELDKNCQVSLPFNATGHVIYIFVQPEYRSLGIAQLLLEKAEIYAGEYMDGREKILWFCEQNAPEKMTPDEYFADNVNAMIDQCDRLIWWDKLGYKRLRYDYMQPPLNPGQEPCTSLTFNVNAPDADAIPACLVLSHISRFFILAVYKGDQSRIDSIYHKQTEWLASQKDIELYGDARMYMSLKNRFYR